MIMASDILSSCHQHGVNLISTSVHFCHTRSNFGISAMLEILQAYKLDHEVAIKCTRNPHIGCATNPPTRRHHNFFLVRRRQMSYDVARLSLMVPIDPCQILPLILVQQLSVRQKLRILKMG